MGNRKTVAFLVSGLMDDFTIKMCNGVMSEAARDDVNLVVVPVKYIDRDLKGLPDIYEYQYRTNERNITKDNVDVLIVAADCIGCLTTRENLMHFVKGLADVPTVMIATRIDGYPSVNFDNKAGVRDGLEYMIEKLGIRKIGMLSGADDYFDARERKEEYLEILKKYDLPFRDSMIVETNLSTFCRNECELMLDMNPDLEAINCVNDNIALTLYEVMRERGLEPGRDMMVLGFDNTKNSAMVNPSLSSVDADAIELGRHAFRMAMRVLKGEEVGAETVPTRFILRDSYGMIMESMETTEFLLSKDKLDQQFDYVFYRYRDEEQKDHSRLRNSFRNIMDAIISYVKLGEHDDFLVNQLKDDIEEFFIQGGALEYTDLDELIPYVERLHKEIELRYSDPEQRGRVYKMLSTVFKSILKAAGNRTVNYETGLDAMLYSMKTLVKDSLNFSYGTDKSYENIVNTLVNVGIRNAYVYIYDKPIVHLEREEFVLPDILRLKAVLTDGVVREIAYSKQPVRIKDIFSHEFMTENKWSMVLMPLYFGDTIYGSILLDLNELMFRNGEYIVNQFATTARVIRILKQNDEIQKQLEENLAIMAENNIVLDRLSRNDVLTGILNRRGFYDIAKNVIDDCREMKRDVILSYVDMNNLKVINDRFGHDDGDFSLKSISQVLTEVVGAQGTVGRIGGDEYAFIYYGEHNEEELRKEITNQFVRLNKESDKPYNITVSCGFYRIRPDDGVSFEDAMATADQDLYEAKQHKDNRVIK